MTDKPLLFSAPMIRALLDGRKTQTRRTLGRKGRCNIFEPGAWSDDYVLHPGNAEWRARDTPFAIGDRLWVREAHALLPATAYRMSIGTGTIAQIEHPTDGYTAAVFREGFDRSGRPRWRPSIHMPRWASRLTLIVTDVRVQRLQEISEADAVAEGWKAPVPGVIGWSPVGWFADLWGQINGPDAWDANPWVCALTFTVHRCNIDQMPR